MNDTSKNETNKAQTTMHQLLRKSRLLLAALLCAAAVPAFAADHVKIGAFQGTFINFPMYVAHDLKLFQKHGIDPEFIYGKGIQPTNMLVSGAVEFSGVAVEHGIVLRSKGQDVRLVVLNQTLPPFTVIVSNSVPTPNAGAGYPAMLKDLKGLKIGISTPGASSDVTMRYLLRQAGLDPQRDVQIVPVGGPSTQIAGLKNGIINASNAFEPIQTEAVLGLRIAKPVLDIEGGKGPPIFRQYAFNGIFVRGALLKSNPDLVRRFVAAIVDAETMVNDPAQIDAVTGVAAKEMGMKPAILKAYISKYRSIFAPIATRVAIENVNKFLMLQKSIKKPIAYQDLVATDFMPKRFMKH